MSAQAVGFRLLTTLAGAALLAGCFASGDDGPGETGGVGGSDDPDQADISNQPEQPSTTTPTDEVVVISAETAADMVVGVSRELFTHAPLVVLADDDQTGDHVVAAHVAVTLGVPLLLTEAGAAAASGSGSGGLAVADELARLDPGSVLTFGELAAGVATDWAAESGGDVSVVTAPEDRAELARISGVEIDDAVARDSSARIDDATDDGSVDPDIVAEVAELEPGTAAATDPEVGELPHVRPADPLDTVTILTGEDLSAVAAVATARASGARVLVAGDADPRADSDIIAALSDQPPSHTLALGEDFGDTELLRQRLAVAATGVELPGGGQTLFPGRRFIALYGTPRSSAMGALGEQPLEETIERAQEYAADYEPHSDETVVPALELIVTIAHTEPGPQGDYSSRTPVDELRPLIDAAADAGLYVVLDLQPGRTHFLSQAQEYEELLLEPHVGLALDPEWRLAEGQRHLRQIGSVDAAEVNEVIEWLADLTAEHDLPQKLLILHQFTLSMITNREDLDTGRDELAVLIHADGFGTPQLKFETWNRLHQDAPEGLWWGWKNFIDEDQPTFTPAETMEIDPAPWFVSYQ